MKTLIELSGNKAAIVEYYLQSMAESLNGKKFDDIIKCRHHIKTVVVFDYKTGERFRLEPSDIITIADEIKLTREKTVGVPLSELV